MAGYDLHKHKKLLRRLGNRWQTQIKRDFGYKAACHVPPVQASDVA